MNKKLIRSIKLKLLFCFFFSFCFWTVLQQTVLKANTAGGFHCLDDHRRYSALKDRKPEAAVCNYCYTDTHDLSNCMKLESRIMNSESQWGIHILTFCCQM